MNERTPPPPVDGYEWHPQPEGADWRLATGQYTKCRGGRGCTGVVVMELERRAYLYRTGRHITRWWACCVEHSYGRWIEDGQIWHWALSSELASDYE